MSDDLNINKGEAFPNSFHGTTGMTLRDYFAAKVMHALFNARAQEYTEEIDGSLICKESYRIADEMIKERSK